jgi:hypothetical protein
MYLGFAALVITVVCLIVCVCLWFGVSIASSVHCSWVVDMVHDLVRLSGLVALCGHVFNFK